MRRTIALICIYVAFSVQAPALADGLHVQQPSPDWWPAIAREKKWGKSEVQRHASTQLMRRYQSQIKRVAWRGKNRIEIHAIDLGDLNGSLADAVCDILVANGVSRPVVVSIADQIKQEYFGKTRMISVKECK